MGAIAADLGGACRRTAGFARHLATQREGGTVWRRMGLVAAAAGDELLLASFQQLHAPADEETFALTLDESRALVEYLERQGALRAPETVHPAPLAARLRERSSRVARVRFGHATYESSYRPDPSMPGAARYAEDTRNDTVHAWMLRQSKAAPWIVCVHGAGMGDPIADLVAFRAASLHAAGFNVAIPVLPHHGPRGMGRFTLAFPSDDPARNLHGAAQAIADVRALLAYIASGGEPAVLYGISLGAYVAAAAAALEPRLAGVIVGVPVVDIPDLMRTHAPARFARHPRFADLYEVARRLDPVTSPLGLPAPSVGVRRIWAGRADRLVRRRQVARLATHWATPEVSWYAGGHLGFFGAQPVRRCIADALVDAGVAVRDGDRFVVA
jgi:pimeloyl-ACP methyl ester carboxylesterase